MRLFKFFTIIIFFLLAAPYGNAEQDFKEWLKGEQKEYSGFLEKRDKEFRNFLMGSWKNFEVEGGKKEDEKPKPVNAPVASEKIMGSKPIDPGKIKKIEKPEKPAEYPEQKTAKPVIKKVVKVEFFGEYLDFPKLDPLTELNILTIDKKGFADFWTNFASIDVKPVINQLNYYKDKKRINDWGCLLLARAYSDSAVKDRNTSYLITWGLMLKSGYDVRAGYDNGEVKLLYRSDDDLYSTPFFSLDKKRYYLFSDKSDSIKSYDADYEGADKKLNVFFEKRPLFITDKIGKRELYFEYKNKEYTVEAYFNPHTIDFMKNIPQFSLEKYFMGEPDQLISGYFVESIKEKTSGFSDYEKVDFILKLVQRAFHYKTDEQQFSKEKYFFPEEMIYYPYSDCEDRSVLFSYLVKRVTGLDVIILDYPGHVAAAVNIPGNIKGDFLKVDGEKYYVTDPTYINSDPGMVIPEYRDKKPEIIFLK